MFNELKTLTKEEKAAARKIGVSFNDLYKSSSNCYGDVYTLYNNYYSINGTFYGYDKRYIYRALLRKLLKLGGFYDIVNN